MIKIEDVVSFCQTLQGVSGVRTSYNRVKDDEFVIVCQTNPFQPEVFTIYETSIKSDLYESKVNGLRWMKGQMQQHPIKDVPQVLI